MTTQSWVWQEGQAKVTTQRGTATLEISHPGAGIGFTSSNTAAWSLFQCFPLPQHSMQLEEAYVREQDLIVRFRQSEEDKFSFQLNHRLLPTDNQLLLGLELWVSIQTNELDVEPKMRIQCDAPQGTEWEIWNHGQVVGDDQTEHADSGPAAILGWASESTLVWLIEHSDQGNCELIAAGENATAEQRAVELFGHFMEKGVIRRARMRAYLCPDRPSPSQIRDWYLEFAASPLPLTA